MFSKYVKFVFKPKIFSNYMNRYKKMKDRFIDLINKKLYIYNNIAVNK